MDQFEHKTLQTKPYDLTYSYYLSPNFHEKLDPAVPTLLICHGFPDDAHMWAGAVPMLSKLPYPMIIPDLLGFAGSSKPTDTSLYRSRQQADSLAQILDHEGVPNNVIPIGHDWGSLTVQRFYLYHKQRCVGLSLLSLAYQVPSDEVFNLDEANKVTAKQFGYPQWEYWNFFTAPDAPELIKNNLMRFYEVNNGNYPSPLPEEKGRDIWMREMFCTPNAMREYITSTGRYKDYTVPLKPYAEDKGLQKSFVERLGRDGLEGPVCYYNVLKDNHNLEDERKYLFKSTSDNDERRIDVPLLYIGDTGDWVCRTDLMSGAQEQGLTPDLETRVVEAGHWVLYEKPEEIARILSDWLTRRFPVEK